MKQKFFSIAKQAQNLIKSMNPYRRIKLVECLEQRVTKSYPCLSGETSLLIAFLLPAVLCVVYTQGLLWIWPSITNFILATFSEQGVILLVYLLWFIPPVVTASLMFLPPAISFLSMHADHWGRKRRWFCQFMAYSILTLIGASTYMFNAMFIAAVGSYTQSGMYTGLLVLSFACSGATIGLFSWLWISTDEPAKYNPSFLPPTFLG